MEPKQSLQLAKYGEKRAAKDERIREALAANPRAKHYVSDSPCKKHGHRLRYLKGDACVICAKDVDREKRGARALMKAED
jgi:hypothetical protein